VDIAREPPPKRKKYIPWAIALVAIVVTTIGLSRLKPAAPTVDRATIWMDTVEQGLMLIRVRGPGNPMYNWSCSNRSVSFPQLSSSW